jgi:hypothetical protein
MKLNEDRMVEAHREGLRQAYEVYAAAYRTALETYPNDYEAQFAYIAGLAQELRRLATKTQNKGFRR